MYIIFNNYFQIRFFLCNTFLYYVAPFGMLHLQKWAQDNFSPFFYISVLFLKNILLLQIIEEGYMCSPECPTLEKTVDQLQLTFRIVKLRLRVLRSNIGKLLCLCVPEKEKWNEFGWVGKSVDEILDDLARYCSISTRIYFNLANRLKIRQLVKSAEKLLLI